MFNRPVMLSLFLGASCFACTTDSTQAVTASTASTVSETPVDMTTPPAVEEVLPTIKPAITQPEDAADPCLGRFEDIDGQSSVVDRAGGSELLLAAADGRLQDTKDLVEAGKTVTNTAPDTQMSALLVWALRGCSEGVRVVLPASKFPHSLDSAEVLSTVVATDDLGLVKVLFEAGAEVNTSTVWGDSPIMSARSEELFDYLLAQGADLGTVNDVGLSVLGSIAAFSENRDFLPHVVEVIGADLRCSDITQLAYAEDPPELEALRTALGILETADGCSEEKRAQSLSVSVLDAGHETAGGLLEDVGW